MLISHINEIITDAKEAREYIKQFSKAFGKEITYADTPSRRIKFATMDDEDAIFVANEFKRMTAEAAKSRNSRGLYVNKCF